MFLAVPSPTMAALNTLTATELAQKIDSGAATSEAIVRAQGRRTRRVRERGELDAVAAAVILQDYLDHAERPS